MLSNNPKFKPRTPEGKRCAHSHQWPTFFLSCSRRSKYSYTTCNTRLSPLLNSSATCSTSPQMCNAHPHPTQACGGGAVAYVPRAPGARCSLGLLAPPCLRDVRWPCFLDSFVQKRNKKTYQLGTLSSAQYSCLSHHFPSRSLFLL